MILLAAALPVAAQEGSFEWPCGTFVPIAGTAGFANGLSALRTNAQTYGAGSFARNRLRGMTLLAIDYRAVYGAAKVPTLCDDSGAKRYGEIFDQPLDLGATNLGIRLPFFFDVSPLHLGLGVFYASSVTTSTMGNRWLSWTVPLFNQYPAFFAPLIGKTTMGGSLTTFSVDWIGGAHFSSDIVSVQAGYTGTRGLYLDVTQDKIALFVNTALTGGVSLSDATYLVTGLERLDPKDWFDDAEKIGMPSAFYRSLPQADSPDPDALSLVEPLRTGHLRYEDVLGTWDLRAAWQFGSSSRLRELAVAGHARNWLGRVEEDIGEGAWYLRAGIVNLPDQPLFGVQGGLKPTLRAEWRTGRTDEGFSGVFRAQVNDPDLLDLYPFAYNAFGLSMELSLGGL